MSRHHGQTADHQPSHRHRRRVAELRRELREALMDDDYAEAALVTDALGELERDAADAGTNTGTGTDIG